ncbi:MAG: GDSL-type esterase/lipase family protein [Bacilli bacterium]|nr:GDSL-type esterase/lipase family protein [Bacilli bacterium]
MKENMKYDTNYYQIRELILNRMLEIVRSHRYAEPGGTVFFGDSLTELCDLDKYYPEIKNKINSGICGITSDMLLHFIDEGVLKFYPSQVVIMVGTNDLGDTIGASPRDIALNIKEMVEIIHYNLSECKIFVCGCIPCLEKYHGYKATKKGNRSNDALKIIFKELKNVIRYDYVKFINVYPALCNKKGEPIESIFVDGLHINDEGYKLLSSVIKKGLLE